MKGGGSTVSAEEQEEKYMEEIEGVREKMVGQINQLREQINGLKNEVHQNDEALKGEIKMVSNFIDLTFHNKLNF